MPDYTYDESTKTLTLHPSITTLESLKEFKKMRHPIVNVRFAKGDWCGEDDIINNILQIVCKENGSLKSCELPDGLTKIDDDAFWCCFGLTSITIPNSVTKIGKKAFYYCFSLTSVVIPERVTEIGDGAFSDCSSLTSITLPDSVTKIGDFAFWGCSNLTKITFCGYLVNIGRGIFELCSELQTIEVCSESMEDESMEEKMRKYVKSEGVKNVHIKVVSQNTQTNPNGSVPCRKKIPPVIPCNNRGR